jgi:hypothetical protein
VPAGCGVRGAGGVSGWERVFGGGDLAVRAVSAVAVRGRMREDVCGGRELLCAGRGALGAELSGFEYEWVG